MKTKFLTVAIFAIIATISITSCTTEETKEIHENGILEENLIKENSSYVRTLIIPSGTPRVVADSLMHNFTLNTDWLSQFIRSSVNENRDFIYTELSSPLLNNGTPSVGSPTVEGRILYQGTDRNGLLDAMLDFSYALDNGYNPDDCEFEMDACYQDGVWILENAC